MTAARNMPKKKRSAPLGRRVNPTQERAKETVDLILDTTASLLDEVGVEAFNTNLLAQRAGILVRTVYRYFPNKYAVIAALTRRLAVEWDRWDARFFEDIADPKRDWKLALRENHIEWLDNAHRVPGGISVLQAMNATPELTELHASIFENMSRRLAAALAERGLSLPAARLLSIARMVINSMTSGMDVALRLKGAEYRQFVAELATSQEAYLGLYLDELESVAR